MCVLTEIAMESLQAAPMGMSEKREYIHAHFKEYRKYCQNHRGDNLGFLFPDGSRIDQRDAEELLIF